jgi:NAD(P)-dependent dehydrogenase (short-subunit alcohol dehydrogenase family)
MNVDGITALVTGGGSGLGQATAKRLIAAGARVAVLDIPRPGVAEAVAGLGDAALFTPADVTDAEQVERALDEAEAIGPLRVVVQCAGVGDVVRLVNKDGSPGSLETYVKVVTINQIGTFNVLRLAAARMATHDPVDGERGVVVNTASVAAFEGQIGQIAYSASKGAVHAMTIVAARDLASKFIRVCTIAPGLFNTPMLAALPDPVKESLGKSVPNPSRLGEPDEYGKLALHIIENQMLNGETIRLDGAIRMTPR